MVRFDSLNEGQAFIWNMGAESDDSAYVFKKNDGGTARHFDHFGDGEIVWSEEVLSVDSDQLVQPLAFERPIPI